MQSVQALVQELVNAVQADDETRSEDCARRLAARGPAALAALQDLLGSSDADLRWWALYALGLARLPGTARLVIPALADADSGVRYCAARALQELADPLAVPRLVETLSSPDRLLQRLAADALIATGAPAVPALIELMQNKDARRPQATRILAQIADQRAIPELFAALDDDSLWIQHWANEGLERMGVGMVFFKP